MTTELTPSGKSLGVEDQLYGMPEANGLYVPTTEQKYHFGKKVLTWDGRLFKYAYFGAAVRTGRGNIFYNAIPATGIDYSLLAADAAVGATSIKMTNQGTVAQTKDGLVGGLIVLKVSTADTNVDATLQERTVAWNTAGGVSDVITIGFDAPLNQALTAAASYAFVMPSEWSDIRYNDSLTKVSHAGPAAAYAAAGYYGFIQTYGKCWLAPQGECGATAYGRGVVWRYDGSIQLVGGTGGLDGQYGQPAGWIMDNNEADNGSTNIFLTGQAY